MKGTLRILAGLGTVAVLAALVAPAALAQCPAAREFGAFGGKTNTKIIIDTNGLQDANLEVGTFWESGNSNTNAGGLHFNSPPLCPSQGNAALGALPWWQQGIAGSLNQPPFRAIRGFVASPGCEMNLCPSNGAFLTVVVEDQTGDGSDAGFTAYTVDETPAKPRWWDHGRTENDVIGNFTHIMNRFPKVDVTSSTGPPPNTRVNNQYADLAINFHGVSGAVNTPLPASNTLASYDIMMFHGLDIPGDPGRARSLWTQLKSIPYSDAAVVGDNIQVSCPDTAGDTYLAVGVTYKGGSGPAVKSFYVGASTRVECNPNIADPDDKPTIRPSHKKAAKPAGR